MRRINEHHSKRSTVEKNTRPGVSESIDYAIADEAEGRRALAALESAFSARRDRVPQQSLIYYDTFDWRLYQRGFRLATRPRHGLKMLRLESPECSLEAPMGNKSAPSFGPRLPEGPLKELISPVVGVRRLLPLVRLDTRSRGVDILDGQEKTVARVQLLQAGAAPPASRRAPTPLSPRLSVKPVRGYPEFTQKVTNYLDQELGLKHAPSSLFEEMLASVNRQPGGYTSKLHLILDRSSSAWEATRTICRHLLETIIANEHGVRRDLDSEFLHDFRVAVRRTRSALAQLKGVFHPEARGSFREQFKWLSSVTGSLRDLDVYLLQMDQHRAALPADVAEDLNPLAVYLRRHRAAELKSLKTALASRRYRRLIGDWRNSLDSALPNPDRSPDAHLPIVEVAPRRICHVYRRVIDQGAEIDDHSPPESLHRLRIECKKLRYLLEFFHSLYPGSAIAPIIRSLKRLQNNLGALNDLEVQQMTLRRFAQEMREEGLASVNCLLAMGRLQGHHDQRKQIERQRFFRRFSEFDTTLNKKRFARLFRPQGDDQS